MEEILKALRDPVWQGWGAMVGIVAVIASVLIYWRSRQRKDLAYQVLTFSPLSPLLSELKDITGKVKISVDGTLADQVHLVEIEVINTGTLPIVAADFDESQPISIVFDTTAEVLVVEVYRKWPQDLDAQLRHDGNKVSLQPLLLNPRDGIGIRALVSQAGEAAGIAVTGRIVGVSRVRKRSTHSFRDEVSFTIAVLGGAFVALMLNSIFDNSIHSFISLCVIIVLKFGISALFESVQRTLTSRVAQTKREG